MRLLERWGDDFADPYRPTIESADVQRLAAAIAPGARLSDLGGAMSLNARLEPAGLVLALGGCAAPEQFDWSLVPALVSEYETAARVQLGVAERRALAPSTAAVPLYHAAIAGFTVDPARQLLGGHQLPFLHFAEWLLSHPDAPLE